MKKPLLFPALCALSLDAGVLLLTGVDGTRGANVARNENRAAWLYLNRLSTVNSIDSGLAFN